MASSACTSANPLRIHQQLDLAVPASAVFIALADPEHLLKAFRHVRSADWLTDPPVRAGSTAFIETDVPFTLPVLRRLVGRTGAEVTVEAWEPSKQMDLRFQGLRVRGQVAMRFATSGPGCEARVYGELALRPAYADALIRPLRPLLERLIARSIERGVRRAEAAVLAERKA